MSYPHYPHPTGQHAYPYSPYHPGTPGAYTHPQTPGAYPTAAYQTPGAYPYGSWHYPYSYFPQQPGTYAANLGQRPPTAAQPTATQSTPAATATTQTQPAVTAPRPVTASLPARQTTFTSYTPASFRESGTVAAAGSGGATSSRGLRRQSNLKGLFSKELRNLMYGFGDDRNPANDTVNVMEEILIEYIIDVCHTSLAPTRKTRLSIEDLRRALSRPADAKKLARMEELLFMQEDIKRGRALFEASDVKEP
ncbi:TFIID-18kDa-domain-containing protein, partial [Neolentinus lepideus HHB14362 ss-1]